MIGSSVWSTVHAAGEMHVGDASLLITEHYTFYSSLKLPPADGSPEDDEFEDYGHSVSRMSHPEGYRITKAAIAGLIGETTKGYEPGWKQ